MRVSTDRQAQEGDSIPAQRQALMKYINEHDDMIFAGEYLDDGVSGTKEDRDELQRMLADVREHKIDLIIVTKLDRLYRSIRHYLNLQDTLDKCGVNWLAIWEPIYDTTTPQGRLIINQMMSIAQFEAEQTGQRIRQVQAYKVSKGEVISGAVPPGFSIVGKKLVPNNDAPIVKEVFEYFSLYGNLRKTLRHFDHTGIFPRTSHAFKNMMRCTKYAGFFRDNPNYCEPIISRELYDDVQRKLTMNVKFSQKHIYLFSGLIKCAECGRVMNAGMYTGHGYAYKRYRCRGKYTSGAITCENSKTVFENTLEKHLLDHVREELQGYIFKAESEQKQSKSNAKRKASIKAKLKKLKELYINDLITLDEYKQDKAAYEAELEALQEDEPVKDLTALNELLSQPFEKIYETFTEEQKRFFWRSIIKEITIDGQRNITVFLLD